MAVGLTIRAWVELLYLDAVGVFGFRAVQRVVTGARTRSIAPAESTVTKVVEGMTTAHLFYFKKAQCLQRSAVVTRLLRRRGVSAEMVIGCHPTPLQAHAWVEVSGKVVSDYQHGLEHFRVLDRW